MTPTRFDGSMEHEPLIALLEALEVFQGLEQKLLNEIAKVAEPLDVEANTFIFDRADAANAIFLIESGSIHIVASSDDPTPVLSVYKRGDIIDLAVLGGQMTRTSAALASTASRVYRLSRQAFKKLQDDHPEGFATAIDRLTKTIETVHLKAAMQESASFTGLSEKILDELIRVMEMKVVPSGVQIINKNEPSDYIYFVVSGRLLVIDEVDGKEVLLREIHRGEVLGEVGVILGTSRAAHVRAARDSTVGRLSQDVFERVFNLYPVEMNRATTAMIVNHLITPARGLGATVPHTIALIPISCGVPTREIGEMLRAALSTRGPTLCIDVEHIEAMSGLGNASHLNSNDFSKASMVNALNDLERTHTHLLLITDDFDSPWTQRCLRQADAVLLLGDAAADPAIGELESALKKVKTNEDAKSHLLLLQEPDTTIAQGTMAWLTPRNCAMHHHLRRGNNDDVAKLARFLTGEAIGLVLGAGGGRGLAHIGVIHAMEDLGIPIDYIGGTSVGALIACQAALGWTPKEILERSKHITSSFGEIPTLPIVSLFSGKKACEITDGAFGDALIEDLSMKYFAISCNISRAGMKIHDSGPLVEAVLASNAAPGIYPPYPHEEGLLVDGAALNSLPVDVMAQANLGGIVLAVNVNPKNDIEGPPDYKGALSGWSVLFSRLNPFQKSINAPSMIEVLMRVSSIGGTLEQRKNREAFTDLYLEPPLSTFSIVDYKKIDQLASAGYDYSKPLLQKWKVEFEEKAGHSI